MILQTSTHFISKFDSKLSLLDKESLREIYINKTHHISTIFLTNDLLYFGCTNSEVYSLNIFSLETTLLLSLNEMPTSLFVLDNNLLIGLEDGKIIKYVIHEDEGERVYNPVVEYKHSAPISCVLYDGEDIVVSDLKNRLILFPSRIQYDLCVTQILYKEYVFTSERNRLFCKTRQALGCILEVEGKIHEFRFNEKGSVVFIRLFNKIQIYEINSKILIKEIEIDYDSFFYCDQSNRLVGWKNKDVDIIEGVLEGEYSEMNIRFSKLEMDVKMVGMKETEGVRKVTKLSDIIGNDRPKEGNGVSRIEGNSVRLREEGSRDRLEGGRDRLEGSFKRLKDGNSKRFKEGSTKNKLRDLFKEDEDDALQVNSLPTIHQSNNLTLTPTNNFTLTPTNNFTLTPTCVFPIYTKSASLLAYSKEGILLSLKGGRSNRVSLKFHDHTLPGVELEDTASCFQGVFSGRAIVLYSQDSLYFYKDTVAWTKRIKPEKVCVSEKYVVVYSTLVYFFNHKGEEIYNFYPQNVSCMYLLKDRLVLCGSTLVVVDDLQLTSNNPLPGLSTWVCIDDNLNIYYRIGEDIFINHNGLSHRIATGIEYPLLVVGNKLIYLKSKEHILPTPHLEYKEIRTNMSK